MFVGIEKKPGFEVLGLKYRGRNEKNEVPELWEAFVPRMGEIRNRVDMSASYGVMDDFDSQTGEYDYIACVEVISSKSLPPGMVVAEVPEQTYAVFKSTLPTIKQDFAQIYGEWFAESGRQRTSGPELEFYGREFLVDQTIYIYIPVVENQAGN